MRTDTDTLASIAARGARLALYTPETHTALTSRPTGVACKNVPTVTGAATLAVNANSMCTCVLTEHAAGALASSKRGTVAVM